MIDRIRIIMEYTKLSQQDFAARLGISPASLSSILTGRTNPTNKHIMGIHQGFPEINVNWLMFGEGDMLTGEHAVSPSNEPGENDGETGQQTATLQPIDPDAANENGALFAGEQSAAYPPSSVEHRAMAYGARRDQRATVRGNGSVVMNAINVDKDERRIKEIRVFYSNGTYESFVPSNK